MLLKVRPWAFQWLVLSKPFTPRLGTFVLGSIPPTQQLMLVVIPIAILFFIHGWKCFFSNLVSNLFVCEGPECLLGIFVTRELWNKVQFVAQILFRGASKISLLLHMFLSKLAQRSVSFNHSRTVTHLKNFVNHFLCLQGDNPLRAG